MAIRAEARDRRQRRGKGHRQHKRMEYRGADHCCTPDVEPLLSECLYSVAFLGHTAAPPRSVMNRAVTAEAWTSHQLYTYSGRGDVRFGSKADHSKPNVCFGPKADMCSAHAVLFCSCCNTLIYEAGTVLHFYLLLLGQLCAFAHLLRLVTWHHLFWCSCLHLC